MREEQLLGPLRFRFTDPADVERYGDRWFVFSEVAIIRLPARRQIELEARLGMTLVAALDGQREDSTLGNLAAAWLAIHLEDPTLAGEFDDFSPLIHLTDWEAVPADDPGKDGATPQPPAKPRRPSRGPAPSDGSPITPEME